MAQPPQKKPPQPNRAQDESGVDDYFDEFFRNAEPPQLDEASEPGQQRQWISDQLMWETTLGMREDETIERVITPGENVDAADVAPQSAAPRKPMSERDRQLLRTQVTHAKVTPPPETSRAPQPARQVAQKPQPLRALPNRQNPATPPRTAPGQSASGQSAARSNARTTATTSRTTTATSSKAPVKPVPQSQPNRPTANAVPQGTQPRKPAATSGGATQIARPDKATPQRTASRTTSQAQTMRKPPAPTPMPRTPASNTPMPRTPMPQTPTPPVMREADLVPEDHIVFDIDENVSREKYFTLGKQVAAALSIAIVSFISGYYLGGTNSTETTVVKTNYATTLAKTDLTTNKKATKPVPKKSPPKKAKPIPAPVKTTDELSSAVTNAQIDNNAAPATATVFQGKEIDIEQFDQRPNSAAATSTSQELSTDSNTDFSNTQTAPLDHESGTANFLPSPQGEETAALIAPAPTPASTDMTTTTATSTTTSVATAELVTTDAAPPKSEDDNLQNLMDQSLQAFQNKQWEALIELSDKILATDPGMVTALTNRAVANTELGSYLPALVDCNLAIKIEPKNPLAINNRGYVYEKMGDIKNAVADYEYACTLGIELSCKEAQRLQSKPIE